MGNVFVTAGAEQVVVYSHRAQRWRRDPGMLHRISFEDRAEGTTRLRWTDRAGAERAAQRIGLTLPGDQELRALMSET